MRSGGVNSGGAAGWALSILLNSQLFVAPLPALAGVVPDTQGAAAERVDVPPLSQPQRCAGDLRLVASVVNETRPALSKAVLRNAAGARMLAVGGRVDDLVLVALAPEYAALRDRAGTLCFLPVFDPAMRMRDAGAAGGKPRPPIPARSASESANTEAKPRALFTQDELKAGLKALGDGNYLLSRELLMKALRNPGGAAGGAHFRLVEREGHSVGMEIRNVRDGSVLQRMGLKTGDVVRHVNGIDVTTPTGMLEALRAAREADALTLTLVQNGKERALRYLVE